MKASVRNSIAIGILLLAGIIGNILYFTPIQEEKLPDLQGFPKEIEAWRSVDVELVEPVLIAIDADETFMRVYTKGKERVTIYIGYHGSGKGGRPSHLPATCYPSSGWRILSSDVERLHIPSNSQKPNQFNRMLVAKSNETQLVRYWFQAEERIMATGWDLNTFRIRSRLTRRPYGSAFVRLVTPMSNNNLEQAKETLDFWTEQAIAILSAQ